MMPENKSTKKLHYGPYEGFESRCRRRLQIDLGMDETATEAILNLRRQVVELQNQIRSLEIELTAHNAGQELRFSRYQNVYYEAVWMELDNQK